MIPRVVDKGLVKEARSKMVSVCRNCFSGITRHNHKPGEKVFHPPRAASKTAPGNTPSSTAECII